MIFKLTSFHVKVEQKKKGMEQNKSVSPWTGLRIDISDVTRSCERARESKWERERVETFFPFCFRDFRNFFFPRRLRRSSFFLIYSKRFLSLFPKSYAQDDVEQYQRRTFVFEWDDRQQWSCPIAAESTGRKESSSIASQLRNNVRFTRTWRSTSPWRRR